MTEEVYCCAPGKLTINGIMVASEPAVLPGDEGFVFFASEVPFLTSDDLTEALRRPRPPPRIRAQETPLPPGVSPPAPPPSPSESTQQQTQGSRPGESREVRLMFPSRPVPPPVQLSARVKKLRQLNDGVTFVYQDNGRFLDKIHIISRGQRIRTQGGSR
jgi:hypothetical protein